MLEQRIIRIIIEWTEEGRIFLVSNGQRQEVSTLHEALLRIEETLTMLGRSITDSDTDIVNKRTVTVSKLKPQTEEDKDWIQTLCGKYRDVLTPTEQYFREKQEEIELEERKITRHKA